MDFLAYKQIDLLKDYVNKHYGKPPRLRGIRLMKIIEQPEGNDNSFQFKLPNKYCGQDVIYVHTRCGSAGWGDDCPDANYIACGGRAWDERNEEYLLDSINDEWDGTYRDHYLKAVIDDEYLKLIDQFIKNCDA